MLDNTVMGWVALFILWGNTGLIALAGLNRVRELVARRAALRPGAPTAGSVALVRGRLAGGPADVAAELTIEQVGRYGAGDARSIVWHDRRAESAIRGGTLEVEGASVALDAEAHAEVWPHAARVVERQACPDAATFDAAWAGARKARGHVRAFGVPLTGGDEVYAWGRFEERDGQLVLTADGDRPLLLSAVDPRGWLAGKIAFMTGVFLPGILLGAAICTGLAAWPPVFDGTISKVGGLLGFLFFLVVLPAGTAARDLTREPNRRFVRGRWSEPAGAPSRAAAAEA